MNKKLIALAIAAALAPAAAMADSGNVTLSGKIAADVTLLSSTGTTGPADNTTHQVNNNNSVVSLNMGEDLGNGMKAFASLTYGLPLANGGTLLGQNQIAGIEGGFGKVFVGAFDNPLKVMGRATDLFADQSTGDARTLTSVGAVEARANDVMVYASPSFSGVQVVVAHSNNPLSGVALDGGTNANTNGATTAMNIGKVTYANGPLSAAIGMHTVKTDKMAAANDGNEKAIRMTIGYTMDAIKVVGSWQKVDNANSASVANNSVAGADFKVLGLGASYAMGATTLKGQYYRLSNDTTANSGANMLALGADYAMSKRTTLQLAYSKVKNDALASYGGVMVVAGSDAYTVAKDSDPSRLSLGMKHTF